MTTSMSKKAPEESSGNETEVSATRGAFADGLTLIRLILTPVVMAVIIVGWPSMNAALLATFLLIIAAATDIFDDYVGGSERSSARQFGWFDDIADIVLICGTLLALLYVVWQNDVLGWGFAVPAVVIIAREIIIGLTKGFEFSKYGWPSTTWGWLKNTLIVFATCILLASPWLTSLSDMARANDGNIMEIFNSASPHVWIAGQALLWIAAAVSVFTAVNLLRGTHLEHEVNE